MRFKLTLVASEHSGTDDENRAEITEAHITILNDERAESLGGALALILLKLREAGFGVD